MKTISTLNSAISKKESVNKTLMTVSNENIFLGKSYLIYSKTGP